MATELDLVEGMDAENDVKSESYALKAPLSEENASATSSPKAKSRTAIGFQVDTSSVNVDIACITHEGLHHENEDRSVFGVKLNEIIEGYVGIFDGHGGQECASYVSGNLAQYLLSHFKSADDWAAGEETMKNMFHKIEDEFREIAKEEDDTSGSCATVVLVRGATAIVANIGDCKAIAVPNPSEDNDEFNYTILTGDHRADADDEQERIEKAGGNVVEGRVGNLQPSRSFGDIDVKDVVGDNIVIPTPEVSCITMQPGGFLIVATDGVWDCVSDSNVVSLVKEALERHNNEVEAVAEELVELALKHDSDDDITVSVLLWTEAT